jgi:uncharacterized protein with NRDE domain
LPDRIAYLVCLVLVALGVSEEMPLVIVANRDEFFARKTAPASWWSHEGVDIFGGRDLEKGGTWLGLTRQGRVALVTNLRDRDGGVAPKPPRDPRIATLRSAILELPQKGSSRGWLVRDALAGAVFPPSFEGRDVPAFNVLVYEKDALYYLRDGAEPAHVSQGLHALSNHRLDTPWPKVQRSLRALAETPLSNAERLFRILSDDVLARDEELPKTGVPLEIERALSAPFVRMPQMGYGTRCSTVVQVHAKGEIDFEERTFDERGQHAGTARERVIFA